MNWLKNCLLLNLKSLDNFLLLKRHFVELELLLGLFFKLNWFWDFFLLLNKVALVLHHLIN